VVAQRRRLGFSAQAGVISLPVPPPAGRLPPPLSPFLLQHPPFDPGQQRRPRHGDQGGDDEVGRVAEVLDADTGEGADDVAGEGGRRWRRGGRTGRRRGCRRRVHEEGAEGGGPEALGLWRCRRRPLGGGPSRPGPGGPARQRRPRLPGRQPRSCCRITGSVIRSSAARRRALLRITVRELVAFERQPGDGVRPPRPGVHRDAEVAVVRGAQDVAAAEVDLVGGQTALNHQEPSLDMAGPRQLQPRQQALEDLAACERRGAELAEGEGPPILVEGVLRAVVDPGGIGADAGHPDEEVHVAHDLGESERRDGAQRLRLPGLVDEPHLVGGDVEVDAARRRRPVDRALDQVLDPKAMVGEIESGNAVGVELPS
jgi:hypothetical protein